MRQILFIALLMCAQFTANAQEKRMAVVQTSTCYMRLQPDYESALETQELMGTVVEIVGESGYWREIVSPQPYKAWTTEKTLVEMTAEQIAEYEKAPKYIFTAHYGQLLTVPHETGSVITDLVGGDVLRVVEKQKGQVSPSGKHGKWAEVMLPDGRTGWTYKKDLRALGERINIRKGDSSEGLINPEKMEAVIMAAQKLRGVPYLWGGMSSKGVDCSGLVRICFLMNDILLPRNASQQVFCGMEIEVERPDIAGRTQEEVKENYDREKALNAIRNLGRGDLVFFGNTETGSITHVGIYLGGGEMIHASHLVRVNSLIPGEENYYENAHRIIRACRLY
jgi:SH3-like domain-containing protein